MKNCDHCNEVGAEYICPCGEALCKKCMHKNQEKTGNSLSDYQYHHETNERTEGVDSVDGKDEICRQAVKKFGAKNQIYMAQGEAGELIAALCRYQVQQRGSSQDVIDEIADMSIMLRQLKQIFGENRCENTEIRKLRRLADRLIK